MASLSNHEAKIAQRTHDTSMSRPIRAAVIGVGHFGQYHANKLAEAKGVEFVAVVDRHGERATAVASRHNVAAKTDYRELFDKVDAVSIATPPASHYAIARGFLEHGTHVLVEKPITETLEDAQSLIDLAAANGKVLQVGHIERFSTVGLRMGEMVKRPLFIQAQRVGSFRPRGEAVSVVFDLMIHDLDLVLGLVKSPIEWVHAVGGPVVTTADDIANARLQFANGCVADLTVSRVNMRTERKMRIFERQTCTTIDFIKRRIGVFALRPAVGGAPEIALSDTAYPASDALADEINSFLSAVRGEHAPRVSGQDGKLALEAAIAIDRKIREHRKRIGV
jgi:predicted dehydrogenase